MPGRCIRRRGQGATGWLQANAGTTAFLGSWNRSHQPASAAAAAPRGTAHQGRGRCLIAGPPRAAAPGPCAQSAPPQRSPPPPCARRRSGPAGPPAPVREASRGGAGLITSWHAGRDTFRCTGGPPPLQRTNRPPACGLASTISHRDPGCPRVCPRLGCRLCPLNCARPTPPSVLVAVVFSPWSPGLISRPSPLWPPPPAQTAQRCAQPGRQGSPAP